MSHQYKSLKGYKAVILNLLDDEPTRWFYSYDLEKVNTKYGFIGLRGTRDCRELVEKGMIQSNHDQKCARYASWQAK